MAAFEQYGLQSISKLGADAQEACNFSSLFVIQPVRGLGMTDGADSEVIMSMDYSDNQEAEEVLMDNYFNYPLVIQALIHDESVEFVFIYDSMAMSTTQVQALSSQLGHVVLQLFASQSAPLSSVSISASSDLEHSLQVNSAIPVELMETCVHSLVEEQAKIRPQSLAIDAWDAQFTYEALDQAASRFSQHLVEEFKVIPGDLVLVCFHKVGLVHGRYSGN